MSEFKDFPADKIAEKLKRVEAFEKKYKPNTTTKAWRKWCTDPAYRKREWELRQSLSNYASHSAHKAFLTNDKSVL